MQIIWFCQTFASLMVNCCYKIRLFSCDEVSPFAFFNERVFPPRVFIGSYFGEALFLGEFFGELSGQLPNVASS